MESKKKIPELVKKYKHIWVASYALIYMPWFLFLEKHVTKNFYVIHSALDDKIPFIEFFVIPYLLWFVFIAAAFIWFFFTDVKGFYDMCKFMFAGMTIFLVISTIMPNGLNLRPAVFARDNIFVDLVRVIYSVDTPTNVFPSLHVFNTLCVCAAVYHSKALKKHKAVSMGAYILSALIILSTVFLKQHSVIDVAAAALMAAALNHFVYEAQRENAKERNARRYANEI